MSLFFHIWIGRATRVKLSSFCEGEGAFRKTGNPGNGDGKANPTNEQRPAVRWSSTASDPVWGRGGCAAFVARGGHAQLPDTSPSAGRLVDVARSCWPDAVGSGTTSSSNNKASDTER
jgi:hypothetical protein